MALTKDEQKQLEDKRPMGYQPGDNEEDERYFVYTRFKEMRTGRTSQNDVDYEQVWDQADKDYRAYVEPLPDDDYRANLFIPFPYAIVRTMLQETISAIEMPKTIPQAEDDKPASVTFNELIPVVLDKSDWFINKHLIDKTRFNLGTAVAKVIYRSDMRDVRELTKLDPKTGKEEWEKKTVVDYDDLYIMFLNLRDFYIDEMAKKIEFARDCIERQILHMGEFQRLYGKYPNAKYVVAGGDTSSYQYYEPPKTGDSQDVEVLHYYNKPKDQYIIVANDVVVHSGPIPYHHKELPYVVFYMDIDPDRFYGRGIPEIIGSLVEEGNLLRNNRLNRAHLGTNPMFLYSTNLSLDEEDFTMRPGGGIPVEGSLGVDQYVREVQLSDTKPSSYREYDQISEDIIRTVGVDYRMQGLDTKGTATEAAILKESSMKHIQMLNLLSQKYSLKRMGLLMVKTMQQYYSIKRVTRIIGDTAEKDYKTVRLMNREVVPDQEGGLAARDTNGPTFLKIGELITPEEIRDANLDIDVEAGPEPYITKPLMQSKWTEMFDRLMNIQDPAVMPPDAKKKVVKQYMEVNDLDADEIMGSGDTTEEERSIADEENQRMDQGEALPPTPNITPEHTMIHLQRTKEADWPGLANPEIAQIYDDHMQGENAQHGGGAAVPAQGAAPGQLSAGLNKSDVVPSMQPGGEQIGA